MPKEILVELVSIDEDKLKENINMLLNNISLYSRLDYNLTTSQTIKNLCESYYFIKRSKFYGRKNQN